MADDDQLVQLDLTLSVTEVPQANSLPLFVRMLEAIHRGKVDVAELAAALEVEERTVHYYIDFGRWLHFVITPDTGQAGLSTAGRNFVESVPSRGRLFATAMFGKKLVKTVQALKRDSTNEDELETLDTREACLRAIRGLTDLSENTAARRASGLAQMLDAAYQPSRIDWATGERRPEFVRKLEYQGRAFLLALGALQFGGGRKLRIGFPLQVRAFVDQQGHGLNARIWRRASVELPEGAGTWFGSVPVNPSTVELASRGGRDFRRFLAMVSPYVALMLAAMTHRDAAGTSPVRVTRDMYGLRVWERERDVGPPLQVVEKIAAQMGIATPDEVPTELRDADPDDTAKGDDVDLLETLARAGFVRLQDTRYVVAPGVEAELREGRDDTASVAELLAPAYEAFRTVLRG